MLLFLSSASGDVFSSLFLFLVAVCEFCFVWQRKKKKKLKKIVVCIFARINLSLIAVILLSRYSAILGTYTSGPKSQRGQERAQPHISRISTCCELSFLLIKKGIRLFGINYTGQHNLCFMKVA